MKNILFLIALIISIYNLNGQTKLNADVQKTMMQWRGERVMSEHNGTVLLKSGWLTMQNNKIREGEFIIDMNTIEESNDVQKLEAHLKSDDFFAVDKYPVAKIVITESTPFENGTAMVSGTLTIRDKTNPVEFNAIMQQKDDGLRFFAKIIIDRSKYNVRYGSGRFFDNLGDKMIYDEIELRVNLLMKQG